MTEPLDTPWLALRTKGRQENTAERCLRQRRINSYLPKYSVVRRWGGKKKIVERPLFPGYVFVQPRVEQYEEVRYIRGSCGLVLVGARPATLSESDLEAVRILADSGVALEVNSQLVPGQGVRVIAGPFEGARGELVRVKNQDRLVINVCLLSSSVSVEVDPETITTL